MAAGHYCTYCGHVCYGGWHGPDGRFDPSSIEVTDAEIMFAMFRNQRNQNRGSFTRTRRNIAFGKHIGVYRPDEWAEEAALERRGGPVQFITVGAFA